MHPTPPACAQLVKKSARIRNSNNFPSNLSVAKRSLFYSLISSKWLSSAAHLILLPGHLLFAPAPTRTILVVRQYSSRGYLIHYPRPTVRSKQRRFLLLAAFVLIFSLHKMLGNEQKQLSFGSSACPIYRFPKRHVNLENSPARGLALVRHLSNY